MVKTRSQGFVSPTFKTRKSATKKEEEGDDTHTNTTRKTGGGTDKKTKTRSNKTIRPETPKSSQDADIDIETSETAASKTKKSKTSKRIEQSSASQEKERTALTNVDFEEKKLEDKDGKTVKNKKSSRRKRENDQDEEGQETNIEADEGDVIGKTEELIEKVDEEEEEEEECAEETVESEEEAETQPKETDDQDNDQDEAEDDDDDDAPEDISFSRSRQDALESITHALQQTKRSDDRAKEKRRNRDKLLKLQKERKKISLQNSRLPDDFLSEIAKIPAQKEAEGITVAPTKPQKPQGHHTVFDSDDDMDVDEEEDFIPLSAEEPHEVDGFEVCAIRQQQRAPPPKSESALDFLQKQLYGSKVKRESVTKHMSRLLKRKGQPGLVFRNPTEKRKKKKHRAKDQEDILS